MKRPNCRERIADALLLQPMTVKELARVLSVADHTVHNAIAAMRDAGTVGRLSEQQKRGRPAYRYGLTCLSE